jgi:hypothetical protein
MMTARRPAASEQGKGPPDIERRRPPSRPRRGRRKWWCSAGLAAFAGTLAQPLAVPLPAVAQDNARASTIQVQTRPSGDVVVKAPAVLLGEPASEVPFNIEVGPVESIPRNSFLRVRGLPHMIALSEGYAIAPGAWAVPIISLSKLRLAIPVGLSGRSEIGVALVTMEGAIIAEAKTSLVIAAAHLIAPNEAPPPAADRPKLPAETPPPAPPAPKAAALPPPAAPAPPAAPIAPARPQISPAAHERATHFMERATAFLEQGNVAAARLFLERAAEEGLAEGALTLGGTYDEAELANMKALGLKPDPSLARRWYERARDLGSRDAAARLSRLGPAR